jgi:hypothetical protein
MRVRDSNVRFSPLAGHRDHRFAVPALALKLHSPRLQDRPFLAARQQSTGRLVECRAYLAGAMARDAPIPIDAGSGLVSSQFRCDRRVELAIINTTRLTQMSDVSGGVEA